MWDFFWNKWTGSYLHPIAKSTICKPFDHGDLGIQSMLILVQATIIKQVWKVTVNYPSCWNLCYMLNSNYNFMGMVFNYVFVMPSTTFYSSFDRKWHLHTPMDWSMDGNWAFGWSVCPTAKLWAWTWLAYLGKWFSSWWYLAFSSVQICYSSENIGTYYNWSLSNYWSSW